MIKPFQGNKMHLPFLPLLYNTQMETSGMPEVFVVYRADSVYKKFMGRT
jgi:hypothetical protein